MERFQKFADYTSMHGFVELFYAKTIFWKCFWTLIIAASIGVTIYQVAGAASNFLSQPTVTSIQQATAEDMLFPPLRICYPHWLYWVDFEKAYKMNFTMGGLLYGLSYLTRIYTSKQMNETKAKENYLSGMTLNNLNTIQDFYVAISANRIGFPDLPVPFDNVSESGMFSDIDSTGYLFFCHIMTEENLKTVMDAYASSDMSSLGPTNQMDTRKTSNTNKFQFQVNYAKLFDLHKYVALDEYESYLTDWLHSMTSFHATNETDVSAVMLPIILYPNAYDSNMVFVSPETDIVKVSVKASIHKWKSTKTSKCESNWRWISPNNTCRYKCLKNLIMTYRKNALMLDSPALLRLAVFLNNYNMTIQSNPITHLKTDEDDVNETRSHVLPNVTTTTFRSILDENSTRYTTDDKIYMKAMEEFNNCSRKCETLYGCQFYTFDINQQHQMMFQGSGTYIEKSYTKVVIEYPTENEVLVMKEEDAKTWEDFVGNVGGLLGIWTGASVISFIQLIYLCCCADCEASTFTSWATKVSKTTTSAFRNKNPNVIPTTKESMDIENY